MASSTTAQTLQKHYLRIIRLWPKESLRPLQVPILLRQRLQQRVLDPKPASAQSEEKADRESVNALYSLLDDRYSKAYPTSDRLLNPEFNPSYYQNLEAELKAAPDRSFFTNLRIRLMKLVRFT